MMLGHLLCHEKLEQEDTEDLLCFPLCSSFSLTKCSGICRRVNLYPCAQDHHISNNLCALFCPYYHVLLELVRCEIFHVADLLTCCDREPWVTDLYSAAVSSSPRCL